MAFQAHAITGKIEIDRAPEVQAVAAVKKDMQGLKASVDTSMAGVKASMGDAAKGGADKFKEALAGLKADFGKSSLLGQGLKLAAGGGAIAGLSLAVRQISSVVKGVAELSNAYSAGEISGGEMTDQVLRSVPIFGEFYGAARDVRSAIDGSAKASREMEKATRAEAAAVAEATRKLDTYKVAKAGAKALTEQFSEAGRTLKQQLNLEGLSGLPRAWQTITDQVQNTRHSVDLSISAKFDDLIQALTKEKDDVAKSLAVAQEKSDASFAAAMKLFGTGGFDAANAKFLKDHGDVNHIYQVLTDSTNALRRAEEQRAKAIQAGDVVKGYADQLAMIDRMKAVAGAIGESAANAVQPAKKLLEGLNAEYEKLRASAQSDHASLRTNQEQYSDRLTSLAQESRAGLSKTDYARGLFKAADDFAARSQLQHQGVQGEEIRGRLFVDSGNQNDVQINLMRQQLDALLKIAGLTDTQIRQAEQDVLVDMP